MVIAKYIFFLLTLGTSLMLSGQEICNDAIDNDGDGFIDLNDDDCICESIIPSGLIPNPSFEDRTCCPDNKEQLYCANSWQQASSATTDYVHTCGDFLGHNGIVNSDAPLPFPDGDGAVGFRDGEGNFSDQYKEYTGAILLENMKVGRSYRFDFFVGFPNRPQHPSMEIAVFASSNRNAIPFGGNNGSFGCPTNDPNFDLIGVQKVSGQYEWVNVVFDFIAEKPYEVIVLGPGCAVNPTVSGSPYFFLDRLALAERSEFAIPFSDITGKLCDDNLTLEVEGDFSFQWYLDGIALLGKEERTLNLNSNSEEGEYSVLMTTSGGCFLSETYDLKLPDILTETTMGICLGETLEFGTQNLSSEGEYTEVFPLGLACDSVVVLSLEIYQHSDSEIYYDLCPGDTLDAAGISYTEAGIYQTVIPNYQGCDSTISLVLSAVEEIEQLLVEDTIYINLGESLDLEPSMVTPDAVRFEWLSEGELISTENALNGIMPLESTSYQLYAYTENDCLSEREIDLVVNSDVKSFIPNVLSFQSIEPNNRFLVGSNPSISAINYLRIYDRWGNLMHNYAGPLSEYMGWDGRSDNRKVEQGVYTYVIEFLIVDGRTVIESGSITVIR